jgi:hypothetical protein
MHKVAEIRKMSLKEIDITQQLTFVHSQDATPENHEEDYKGWVMPPLREKYIKHKANDPL